jgi:hypothetical protein
MDLLGFIAALDALTLDDVRALAIDLDGMVTTAAEEIDVTRAYLSIEAALRGAHKVREAAQAGHRASVAVIAAADRGGADLPDAGVTRVARAAGSIARGIVALRHQPSVEPAVHLLVSGFRQVAPVAALA